MVIMWVLTPDADLKGRGMLPAERRIRPPTHSQERNRHAENVGRHHCFDCRCIECRHFDGVLFPSRRIQRRPPPIARGVCHEAYRSEHVIAGDNPAHRRRRPANLRYRHLWFGVILGRGCPVRGHRGCHSNTRGIRRRTNEKSGLRQHRRPHRSRAGGF